MIAEYGPHFRHDEVTFKLSPFTGFVSATWDLHTFCGEMTRNFACILFRLQNDISKGLKHEQWMFEGLAADGEMELCRVYRKLSRQAKNAFMKVPLTLIIGNNFRPHMELHTCAKAETALVFFRRYVRGKFCRDLRAGHVESYGDRAKTVSFAHVHLAELAEAA